MENREAIEILSRPLFMDGTPKEILDAHRMAISALEKQAKKPAKAKFNKRYNKFVYFCPVCGEITGNYDFCSECDQAIDYDNSEPYEGEGEK